MGNLPQEAPGATRRTGSYWWLPLILDDRTLSATETLVLISLAGHVDANDTCYIGIETLARQSRTSRSTLKRRLDDLERKGYLSRSIRRRPDGGQSVNTYQLHRAALSPMAQFEPGGDPPVHLGWTGPQFTIGDPAPRSPMVDRQELSLELLPELPLVPRTLIPAPGFDEFWEVFPLKKGKGAAEKAWAKAVKKAEPSVIIDGARRYAEDPKRDPSFTKYPQGWLNDERWGDAAQASVVKPVGGRVFLPGTGWVGNV